MMPKRPGICLIFSFIICLSTVPSQAQRTFIRASVKNYNNKPVRLQEFYGADNRITDSVSTDQHGRFIFNLSPSKPAGVYRLLFENRQFLDLIYTSDQIDFTTEFNHLLDSIRFTNSRENQLYYQYLGYRALSQYRLTNLRRKIPEQSPQTEYFRSIQHEIQSLILQEHDFTNSLISQNPESIAAKLMLIDRIPGPDPLWNTEKRSTYTFTHYLDEVVFNDTILLRTNAISAKIISCLSLVIAMNTEADSIIPAFRQASFNLLAIADSDKTMFAFVKKYLSEGFKKLGYAGLSREISALPDPGCEGRIAEDKSGKNLLPAPGLIGKQFPVIRFDDKKIKGNLPRKGQKTIVLLPVPGCRWSIKMENELLDIAPSARNDGYEIYILSENDNIGDKADGTIKTIFMSSKVSLKLRQFREADNGPMIFIIGSDGRVLKEINSWINLREKLTLNQIPDLQPEEPVN